jgi:competence protein ComEC
MIYFMKKKALILILSLILFTYAFSYQKFLTGSGNVLTISFLDVGQGDAIYIRAPNGNDVLVDGGPDDTVLGELRTIMPRFDQDIDLMIATHPDKDHIAGLSTVFESYDVRNFLRSEVSSGTSFDISLHDHAERESGLRTIIARRGQRYILDKKQGVYLDILFPDQNTSKFKETNDASIVARLVYGKTAFLLTGDSPISVEQFLARNDKNGLRASVLKLGHHGSNTSTSNEYLDQVQPVFAIVSAGKNNTYHHPHPAVVSRVSDKGVTILSTIELGTITLESNGQTVQRK